MLWFCVNKKIFRFGHNLKLFHFSPDFQSLFMHSNSFAVFSILASMHI